MIFVVLGIDITVFYVLCGKNVIVVVGWKLKLSRTGSRKNCVVQIRNGSAFL